MTEMDNQRRGAAPRQGSENPQGRRVDASAWDYERHLAAEHNLLVEAERGWPTAVKRYRLFRPMEGKRAERTLLAHVGTGPAALAHFFHYIHPAGRTHARRQSPAGR